MSSVHLSIQFPAEFREQNPGADSHIVPEKHRSHLPLEAMRGILYTRARGIPAGKQPGTLPGALRKTSATIKRHASEEWEIGKKHFQPPALVDVQPKDLEDIGILVGEVYDERIIEDSLRQGENPIDESLITLNQNKKGC